MNALWLYIICILLHAYGHQHVSVVIATIFRVSQRILIKYKINPCTALLVGRSRDRFAVVSLGNISVATDGTMCPGVDSASKNKYKGFLLG